MKTQDAMDFLRSQIKLDSEYAWGWLCNIAMSAYDEGLSKPKANLAAARFMKLAFDIDMTKHEHFSDTQTGSEQNELSASEALYGFAGWLTTQNESITAGSKYDAAIWAEKVTEFCKANTLADPKEGWEKSLVHPNN